MSQYWNIINPLALQMKLIITSTILLLLILVPINAVTDEMIDQAAVLESMPKTSMKCGECPCVNPCSQQQLQPPPPPPPPPPRIFTQYCPPPPPRFYYFSGPPDETQVTPPPPRFTYVTSSPQGNVYPTDPFNLEIYNGAISYRCALLLGLLLLVICGLLQILVFYGVQ